MYLTCTWIVPDFSRYFATRYRYQVLPVHEGQVQVPEKLYLGTGTYTWSQPCPAPVFFPRGGRGRRNILMDSHLYSYGASIFTLGAPHEEVQGRLAKLHPGDQRLYPNFWLLCAYMVYLLLLLYCGALVGCLGVSKNKTLNSDIISVVFFSCFKKFKCLGDVLDSVIPIKICYIEVISFRRSYNLAQILI